MHVEDQIYFAHCGSLEACVWKSPLSFKMTKIVAV